MKNKMPSSKEWTSVIGLFWDQYHKVEFMDVVEVELGFVEDDHRPADKIKWVFILKKTTTYCEFVCFSLKAFDKVLQVHPGLL